MKNKWNTISDVCHWSNGRDMEIEALRSLMNGKCAYLMGKGNVGLFDDGKGIDSVLLCTSLYGVCIEPENYHLADLRENGAVTYIISEWNQPTELVEVFWHIGVSRETTIRAQLRKTNGELVEKGKKIPLLELVTAADEHATWLNTDILDKYFPRKNILGIPEYRYFINRKSPKTSPIFISHNVGRGDNRLLDGFVMPYVLREDNKK